MLNLDPGQLIAFFQQLSPETLSIVQMMVCFSAIVIMHRLFGQAGLQVYIVLAILGANIEITKMVDFSFYAIPLGTILFSSTFLATDILAEYYGKESARKAVWLGFASYLLFVVFIMITLGFKPSIQDQSHDHILALFKPAPAFFLAGMTAYLVSQHSDVWIYVTIKRLTRNKYMWLRNNVSTWISALIDNTVFSVLAWRVLNPDPVDMHSLIFTYILGTYLLRIVISVADTPFLYLAGRLKPLKPEYAN